MDITFTGKIIEAQPIQTGVSKQGNQWAKREFVIEEINNSFNSKCAFTVFGDDKIKSFHLEVGELVTVHLGINANKSQDRWFNQVNCWKVEHLAQSIFPPHTEQGQFVQSQVGQQYVAQPYPAYQQQPTNSPQQGYSQQGNIPPY